MVFDLKEWLRRVPINIRLWFVWLSARNDTPKGWFAGGYSKIKILRVSLCIAALLNYAAFSLGTDFTSASFLNLWYGLASSLYVIVAFVYLLGFRMWYSACTVFFILSAAINFGINFSGGPLGIGTASPAFATAATVLWLYLLVIGLFAMKLDKGSKLNEMLQQS